MSDPSAIQVPVHQALTSDMLLGLKPSAPKTRTYRQNIPALNKSVFTPADSMIFEIPAGRKGTWYDPQQSYLKFSVQCASTSASNAFAPGTGIALSTGVYVDNSAYSFIQRCDIYNSSNLLETINEYGQLANFLIDTSLTKSDKAGLSPILGTNPFDGSVVGEASYAQYDVVQNVFPAGDRSGISMSTSTIPNVNTSVPYTFCLPLLSGIVGSMCSKMVPVGALNSPIRLEFYLSANDDGIYYGTSAAGAIWQLLNCELVCTFVEIQDDVFNDQLLDKNIPHYISTQSYRQSSFFIPSSTSGEFTSLLPFRMASLTALYGRFLNQTGAVQGVNATASYRKTSSINPNFSSYYVRCGSSLIPNKPVYLINGYSTQGGAEAYAELMKSFHALTANNGNSAITAYNYNVAQTAIGSFTVPYAPVSKASTAIPDTSANAFAIGLEMQAFSNRSDTILSGVSTLNTQLYFTGIVNSGATVGTSITSHFFAQFDMILVIQDGIMSAKF